MTSTRTWRNLIRLWALISLFTLSTAPALAYQGLKDIDDESAEAPSALDYPGLVGEGEYVSPQFDLEITWSSDWAVGEPDDPIVEHAIGGYWDGPIATEPNVGDIVFLVDSDTGTAVLSLGFSYLSPTISIDDVVAYMQSPEYLVNNLFLSQDAEVLALDASRDSVAVVARDSAPNDDHVIYQMMVLDPEDEDFGFWVGLDMYDPEQYQPIVESVESGIDVEDNEIFSVLDAGEVLDAVQGNALATEGGDADSSAGDVDDALAPVGDHVDDLDASLDRMDELLDTEEGSAGAFGEIYEIVNLWIEAPTVAREVDLPDEDVQLEEMYLDYTDSLADAANALNAVMLSNPGSDESLDAAEAFIAAYDDARDIAGELDILLTEAGV